MGYEAVLALCEDATVGAAVVDALSRLLAESKDLRNLANDTHERTIAEMLARHLQPHLAGYEVNGDYNRMGYEPKKVIWRVEPGASPDRLYPHIIVHPPTVYSGEFARDRDYEGLE